MAKKYLVILEVSQKQAYIFSSNKLKDNVTNSAVIAWVTDSDFFQEIIDDTAIYQEEENLVYAGGGHTVLVFDLEEQAKEFVWKVTLHIHTTYPELEMFAKVLACEGEIGGAELKQLSQELEKKKSKRNASFHQRSFGIEERTSKIKETSKRTMPEKERIIDQKLMPNGFEKALELERLGGSKEESNFIAVIHIDGNSMGKRVENFRDSLKEKSWIEYRKALKEFSEAVDCDFKAAYKEMADEIADLIMRGGLEELQLATGDFPIRRIITAGDDICFITEGRIGLECARIFIEKLAQKENKQDKQHYAACAGVAIVHQKYPFYRAYELAEELCSNAKQFIATTYKKLHPESKEEDETKRNQIACTEACANICAIDWHIEYGEMKDGLDEIRKMYQTNEMEANEDGTEPQHLELRPYILLDPKGLLEPESIRHYQKFKKLLKNIQTGDINYARGKLKTFRQYLKEGETASAHFIRTRQIDDIALLGYQDVFVEMDYSKIGSGDQLERKTFTRTMDQKKRCLYFDAIELFDTFISIEK